MANGPTGQAARAGERHPCLAAHLPLQGDQGLSDIAAHLGCEQPKQRPQPALYLHPLDHPDMAVGVWLKQVLEDDLAQRHRAFGNPAPPRYRPQ